MRAMAAGEGSVIAERLLLHLGMNVVALRLFSFLTDKPPHPRNNNFGR